MIRKSKRLFKKSRIKNKRSKKKHTNRRIRPRKKIKTKRRRRKRRKLVRGGSSSSFAAYIDTNASPQSEQERQEQYINSSFRQFLPDPSTNTQQQSTNSDEYIKTKTINQNNANLYGIPFEQVPSGWALPPPDATMNHV